MSRLGFFSKNSCGKLMEIVTLQISMYSWKLFQSLHLIRGSEFNVFHNSKYWQWIILMENVCWRQGFIKWSSYRNKLELPFFAINWNLKKIHDNTQPVHEPKTQNQGGGVYEKNMRSHWGLWKDKRHNYFCWSGSPGLAHGLKCGFPNHEFMNCPVMDNT